MVSTVDGVALAAIASQVTRGDDAAAAWTAATARQIFLDVALAKAAIKGLNQGFDPDTVVLDDVAWTYAMATFVDAGYVPREATATPLLTGEFPVILGMRWLSTTNSPTPGDALIVDSTQLGGMADEQLAGPGYQGAVAGIETKSIRDEKKDKYDLRARRITVPVVLEPDAGFVVEGVNP